MRKMILSMFCLLCCAGVSYAKPAGAQAADGGQISLKDIARGAFRAKGIAAIRPLADGESYSMLSEDSRQILQKSFKTGKQTAVLFDAATARGAKLDYIDGYILSPDGRNILIQTETEYIYRRSFRATYYIYNVRNNRLAPLSGGGKQQAAVWSPDGNQVAFVRDNNIFLIKLLYDNSESQVTKDGSFGHVLNGIPDWVYEEEFGLNRQMTFTADSRQIVWVRSDESAVKSYSLTRFKGLAPEESQYAVYPGTYDYKYPKAGEDNSKVELMSFDIKSHQTRRIPVPLDADGYIPRIAATADSSRVAVFTLNRHQDCLRIYMANPLTTVCKLAIEQQAKDYVLEDNVTGVVITPKHIVMPSDRDGWNHIYIYTHTGQLLRQIVKDKWDVATVYGLDDKTGDVYFSGHGEGPTDTQVYVGHKDGRTERLTTEPGQNRAIFSTGFRYFVHVNSRMSHPEVYTLCNAAGKRLTVLEDNKALRDKLAQYHLSQPEMFHFTTSEGVELNGWMVRPKDFDPQKRYPVIMYQYGGPGNQQVIDGWGIGMCGSGAIMEHYWAEQGFIAVCVDNRGTGGRGSDFQKCTYMKLGQLEARDQVETAIWLGKQSYVDKDRIGIWGWSYGGWNTLMSMSEGRPVFRAGVAIAPVTSYRFYDTVYTERFMRTPKENAAGYADCPITRAEKLSGSLLLCHGLADDNVHYQNTAEYTEALVQADKDFRQLVYTNRDHGISGGNTRYHLYRQAVNHFREQLRVGK